MTLYAMFTLRSVFASTSTSQFNIASIVTQTQMQTRMHSSRMRTTRSSGRPGGGVSPRTRHSPPGADPPPPVNRITDACKNITLPQTSFAGGKNGSEPILCINIFVSIDTMLNFDRDANADVKFEQA